MQDFKVLGTISLIFAVVTVLGCGGSDHPADVLTELPVDDASDTLEPPADSDTENPVVVEDIHEDYTAQPSCEELCAQNERECGTYLDCTCGDCSTGFVCENGKCEREIDPCIEICMQRDCGEFSGCNCGGCANLWTCNGGKCVECKPDVIEKCVDSKIYSFDSCGNRGKLSYDCVTRCKSYGDTYKKCEWDDNWDRGRCICSKQQEGDYWEFNCSYSSNYSSCSIVFGESKLCVLPSFGSYSSSATKHHCDRIPCPKDGNCQALCGKQIFCGEDLKVKCECDIVNEPMCGFTLPGCVYR